MIDIRKLSVINQLADLGANGVAKNIELISDGGEMRVKKIDFFDITERHSELPDDEQVGIRVRMKEAPGGHLLVLFSRENASKITKLMLSDVIGDTDEVSTDMAKDAAEELGNMLASGFIDGWADAFGRTIDHSAPKLVYQSTADIVKRTSMMGNNPFALIFHAEVVTDEANIDLTIYLFPEMEEFVKMINAIGDSG